MGGDKKSHKGFFDHPQMSKIKCTFQKTANPTLRWDKAHSVHFARRGSWDMGGKKAYAHAFV